MRLTELFRRGITIPLTRRAEDTMRAGTFAEPARVEWLPLNDDGLFYSLFTNGLIAALNSACRTMIDEHEVETLDLPALGPAIDVVAGFRAEQRDDFHQLVEELLMTLRRAKDIGRPVFFVL